MPRNHVRRSRAARNVHARTLRFGEDLRQKLEGAASQSVRSVNSEILFRLLRTFKQEAAERGRV
jgi:hypothetical protein